LYYPYHNINDDDNNDYYNMMPMMVINGHNGDDKDYDYNQIKNYENK
jgi:hypothetical protein